MKYRAILLFGAPGSGKGTQGRIIGKIPNFFYFACGDAFRNLRIDDPLGRTFIDYSSRGQLVPDEPTIELWKKTIRGAEGDGSFLPAKDTLVLDGIPRNPRQVQILNEFLDVRAVFNLACKDINKMIERLQRRALRENRLDDANLDVIKRRFETYELETRPVLDCYAEKLVHHIDSTQEPVKVMAEILDIVVTI
jgi:adenylate kinase